MLKVLSKLFLLFLSLGVFLTSDATVSAQSVEVPGFHQTVALSGLDLPTSARFAPDGRVFVSEKSGVIKVFDDINDTSPTVFADLSDQVYTFRDHGLNSIAVDPDFPERPYIYATYSLFGNPGGRIVRLTAAGNTMVPGSEAILVEGLCTIYGSHSVGDLRFGSDKMLYASGGDGASFDIVDYGQTAADDVCNDPINEGGALRSQDLQTLSDPQGISGAIIRINPDTGAPALGNPLLGGRTDDDRVIAYGLRNPFRFVVHPTTNNIYVGDVGWNTWEEINLILSPTDGIVENFGWPCYEGLFAQPGYDAANLPICENLYFSNSTVSPLYSYNRTGQGGSISAIAVYTGSSNYPGSYINGLFFGDYSQGFIRVMQQDESGVLDPSKITTVMTGAYVVDIQEGTEGDLYYLDIARGTLNRLQYFPGNIPPVAIARADVTGGDVPLTVNFDGSDSFDGNDDDLTYEWELDGDGDYDDANIPNPTFTYTNEGVVSVSLRVSDGKGGVDTDTLLISIGNKAPVVEITSPTTSTHYAVGDVISFSGTAYDPETGPLPVSSYEWDVVLFHCAVGNPNDCHEHPVDEFQGVTQGSIVAPDHEYPSHLEFRLRAKETESSAWWDSDWTKRSTLRFSNGQSLEDLADFPVLVKLTPNRIDYSLTKENGEDLRFIDADGTELSYEIESWDPNGDSYLWVEVPQVDRLSNSDFIYMYYGNPDAPNVQNKAAVWEDDYVGVWHLADFLDSTAAAHNGTNFGSTPVEGMIGQGRQFNGVDQRVQIAHTPLLSYPDSSSFTMSAWVKPGEINSGWSGVVTKSRDAWPWYGLWINPENNWIFGGPGNMVGPETTDDWRYITLIQNGLTNERQMYVDGVLAAEGLAMGGTGIGDLWIGGANGASEYFQGDIDEVRIANTARTQAWINAQYQSMLDSFVNYADSTSQVQLEGETSVRVDPQTVNLTFETDPSGLDVTIYGTSHQTPFTREVIAKARTTISAPTPQTQGGTSHEFVSWSDGGPQTHDIIAPTQDRVYTAHFTGGTSSDAITWHSQDVVTKSGLPQAYVRDETGNNQASLEFYTSTNLGGVNQGSLYPTFTQGEHPDAQTRVDSYWSGGMYPYAGKSSVGRGNDVNETNAPSPTGADIRDLQLHPPDTDNLVVAVFVAPRSGTYTLSNLAVRRVDGNPGQSVRYKVFNPQREMLANIQATSQAWVQGAQSYDLGELQAGDKIYFAVDRDGVYWWDSTEITWSLSMTPSSQLPGGVLNGAIDGISLVINGQKEELPFELVSGETYTVYAPTIQTLEDGRTVQFTSWSNGEMQEQTFIATPTTSISANYTVLEEAEPEFSNGFEEGDTSVYPQGNIDVDIGNTLEVKTVKPRNGAYSLEITSDGTGPTTEAVLDWTTYPAMSTVYVQTHFSLEEANIQPGNLLNLFALKNLDYRRLVYVSMGSDYRMRIYLFDPAQEGYCEPDLCGQGELLGVFGPEILRDGAWHEMQFRYTVDTQHGAIELWLDGERIADLYELNTGTPGQDDIHVITWGSFFSTPGISSRHYFDDLSLSDRYIPESEIIDPPQDQAVWNSYDVQIQEGSPQGTVQQANGTETAQMEFYKSINAGGVDRGSLFTTFNPGLHPDGAVLMENYWADGIGGYTHVGKSTIDRGSGANETNAPSPSGVRDLQLHPPDDDTLTVAAFIVPSSGTYEVRNLAARRVDGNTGQSASLKVFSPSKSLLATVQTVSQAWATDANTYSIEANAGDRIYLAVDRDGLYWWDFVEIAWQIVKLQ